MRDAFFNMELTMKMLNFFVAFQRHYGRRFSLGMGAILMASLLAAEPAHAQRRPPTIPNQGQPVLPANPHAVNPYWSPSNPNGTIMPISQLRNVPSGFTPAISAPPTNPYWSPSNPTGTIMPISQLRNVPSGFTPAISAPPTNPYWSPSNPNGTIMPISQLRNVPSGFAPAISPSR